MINYNDTVAHMNGRELDVLDMFQNASHHYDGNPNIRIYTKEMEDLLSDPKLVMAMLRLGRQNYAKGGVVGMPAISQEELEHCRALGRNGDDCLAIVGPRLKAMLDIWAQHKGTTNPVSGRPEYFFLDGLFNTLGQGVNAIGSGLSNVGSMAFNGLKSVASPLMRMGGSMLPMLGGLAGTALGARFGGPAGAAMGSQFGNMLGGMGGNMLNSFAGQQQPSAMDPYAESAGQHMGQMAQNMYGGMSPQQAMGNAVSNYGQQNFGQSPLGMGMQAGGQQFAQGASPQQVMMAGYNGAGGLSPAIAAARNAYQNYQGGMSPQQAAMGFGSQLMQQPQMQQPQMSQQMGQ